MPVLGGDATGVTATDIINDARDYAASVYASAESLVDAAQRKVSINYPLEPSISVPDIIIDPITYEEPEAFEDAYVAPTDKPTEPIFQGVKLPGEITEITPVGDFDKSKLWEGDPPVYDVEDFNKDAPEISEVNIPDLPPLENIPYPELEQISIPKFDGVVIPAFTPSALIDLPPPPDDIVKAYKDTYESTLPEMKSFIDSGMNEILNKYAPEYEDNRARLIDRINKSFDGGTGLSDTFEQNIYDRGRSRAEQEQQRLTNEITESADKRGHFVPDGSVIAGLFQSQVSAAMVNAQYASETTIERAKMELNHLEFIMQLSNGIKDQAIQMVMQYSSTMTQVNSQALEHGKNVANIMTELYNSELKRHAQSLELLSIQAQVYEVEFKAALADLEIFRVEAEVAKLNNDINKSEVDLYVARLNGQKTQVEIYGIQIDAINTKVKAEAETVRAFSEEVRAYTALINSKTAEMGVYTAALNGNKTQADIYVSEVNSYATRVDAEKSKVELEIAASESVISYNKNLSEQFRMELSAYESEIKSESTRFDSSAKVYISRLEGFKSELNAKKITLEGQAQTAQLEVNSSLQDYKNISDFRVQTARSLNNGSKNVADIAMGGAQVYTNIGAAALASQNSMVTLVEQSG